MSVCGVESGRVQKSNRLGVLSVEPSTVNATWLHLRVSAGSSYIHRLVETPLTAGARGCSTTLHIQRSVPATRYDTGAPATTTQHGARELLTLVGRQAHPQRHTGSGIASVRAPGRFDHGAFAYKQYGGSGRLHFTSQLKPTKTQCPMIHSSTHGR